MKKLKMGMVGGGIGAFIGEVHRKAARMDGGADIVAGAFDVDPEKSLEQGRNLGLDPKRVYRTYKDMIAGELALPKEERIDFVSVCTPNHTHFPIAKACLEAGFNVMCEKPMTLTVAEAEELEALVKKTKLTFGLMHTYTGYPMVKLARDMVKAGDLGKIRKVVVQYPQGWLFKLTGKENMQASWRTDPKRSGRAGCMGDIGTHAANLAEFVTGLKITEVLADLTIFVKGRKLDDDGNVLFHMEKGAKGVLTASQIAPGEENDLHIWVYGEKKALAWYQENPNYLRVFDQEATRRTRTTCACSTRRRPRRCGSAATPTWGRSPPPPCAARARRAAIPRRSWRRSRTTTATSATRSARGRRSGSLRRWSSTSREWSTACAA